MQCPECNTQDGIKGFLRAQHENLEDTDANVVTILCTKCGNNESVFIEDFLGSYFPDWDEESKIMDALGGLFGGLMNGMTNFEPPALIGGRSATNGNLPSIQGENAQKHIVTEETTK